MRRLLILAVALALGAAGATAWSLLRPGPDREVVLTVERGAPLARVLEQARREELLPSALTARAWLAVRGRDRGIRWGRYRVPPRSRPVDVLRQLLEGRVAMVEVTVPEGLTRWETARIMADSGLGTAGEWEAVTGTPEWIRDLAPRARDLEGFLFPDTYRFAEGTGAAAAAHHMVDRFREVWREVAGQGPCTWEATPFEVVTLASLVEAETPVPGERPTVAGVYLNRLRRGMLLQCDPTVVFVLKREGRWTGRLLRRDLEVDDPYNTYRYPGLPPGPIASPGRAALEAACRPADVPYLYFVASPGGGHAFSRTLADHNRAVARWRRWKRSGGE